MTSLSLPPPESQNPVQYWKTMYCAILPILSWERILYKKASIILEMMTETTES